MASCCRPTASGSAAAAPAAPRPSFGRQRPSRRLTLAPPAAKPSKEDPETDTDGAEVRAGWVWPCALLTPPATRRRHPPLEPRRPTPASSRLLLLLPQAPSSSGAKPTSLASLTSLAGKLLMNAASLRAVRGQTYCTFCRGAFLGGRPRWEAGDFD